MKILIRHNLPDDEAFIYATYIRNQWFSKDNTTTLKRATWSAIQHKRLEGILGSTQVKLACLDEDPDTIIGYAFMDGANGAFCYVKLAFRSEGLGIKDKLIKELRNAKE